MMKRARVVARRLGSVFVCSSLVSLAFLVPWLSTESRIRSSKMRRCARWLLWVSR